MCAQNCRPDPDSETTMRGRDLLSKEHDYVTYMKRKLFVPGRKTAENKPEQVYERGLNTESRVQDRSQSPGPESESRTGVRVQDRSPGPESVQASLHCQKNRVTLKFLISQILFHISICV